MPETLYDEGAVEENPFATEPTADLWHDIPCETLPVVYFDPLNNREMCWESEDRFTIGDINIALRRQSTLGPGGELWCDILLQYLVNNKAAFPDGFWANKTVIELGSGPGLIGIYLALVGARVTLTDMDPVVHLLRRNLMENCKQGTCHACVEELEWGVTDLSEFKRACASTTEVPPDFLIASECIYNAVFSLQLIDVILELSSERTNILLSYSDRFPDVEAEWFRRTRNLFTFWTLPSHPARPRFHLILLKKRLTAVTPIIQKPVSDPSSQPLLSSSSSVEEKSRKVLSASEKRLKKLAIKKKLVQDHNKREAAYRTSGTKNV
eukprot:TRINITY_DN66679_c0_g1_i1.p1 TRINITY_DN66679_c0_g1~~TRINITY_DN66679_c0_g1_i1.p1  ORF type:complete len:324 (+),score=11.73 TRINITY_DN66679_c0_g1_i1:35-1006(+)